MVLRISRDPLPQGGVCLIFGREEFVAGGTDVLILEDPQYENQQGKVGKDRNIGSTRAGTLEDSIFLSYE